MESSPARPCSWVITRPTARLLGALEPRSLGRPTSSHPVVPRGSNGSVGVAAGHPGAKVGKLIHTARRTGMVRTDTRGLGSKTEGQRDIQLFQGSHGAVDPGSRRGAIAVGPARAGGEMANAEPS